MKTIKIVAKTLAVVSGILASLYAIGRIDYEKKQHEAALNRVALVRRKNRALHTALMKSFKHLSREERSEIMAGLENVYAFEKVIENFNK